MSKTDAGGIIEYSHDYFVEISDYTEAELIGKPHSIVRHPDMPKVDPITNEIISHTAFRKATPQEAIYTMVSIYQKLIEIEKMVVWKQVRNIFVVFLKKTTLLMMIL